MVFGNYYARKKCLKIVLLKISQYPETISQEYLNKFNGQGKNIVNNINIILYI